MDLKELSDLISIRQYVVNMTAHPTIARKTINEMSDMLLLLDKKIIGIIVGSDFKEFIGYDDVQDVKIQAIKANDMHAGMKRVGGHWEKDES
jgi:hypothetical protein